MANLRRIIVSHPDNGLTEFGLSEQGIVQVEQSLASRGDLGPETLIVSSDFRRALDSAEIAQRALCCETPLATETRLRERFFGHLELTPDSAYHRVWEEDARDPDSDRGGMESANQVTARVTSLIAELERQYSGRTILLVSHGDALQLLQTAFLKQNAARHRALEHMHTAEIRLLKLAR